MKKILVASLLALSVNAMASGVGEYSTGYRMGQITKSSVKGLMMKSGGIRVGRIVKASTKGVLVNSYEIMMQQGNAGNQFKNMSISSDPDLYECAVNFLKAGQKVKVHYSQSIVNLDLLGRNTSYDIVKIEPVKGLN